MDISSASTMWIPVPVTANVNGANYDPTGDAVYMAFLPNRVTPGSSDWHTGTWESVAGVYTAKCLVGPANGGVVLGTGTWAVWVKVTDNPEVPVLEAGYLNVE